MKCEVKRDIRILKSGWRIAEASDDSKYVKNLKVTLEIEGNKKKGYYLLMTPENCFTADSHYDTLDEAIEDAVESFEISPNDFKS